MWWILALGALLLGRYLMYVAAKRILDRTEAEIREDR